MAFTVLLICLGEYGYYLDKGKILNTAKLDSLIISLIDILVDQKKAS